MYALYLHKTHVTIFQYGVYRRYCDVHNYVELLVSEVVKEFATFYGTRRFSLFESQESKTRPFLLILEDESMLYKDVNYLIAQENNIA